jgi:hypothetical protein
MCLVRRTENIKSKQYGIYMMFDGSYYRNETFNATGRMARGGEMVEK